MSIKLERVDKEGTVDPLIYRSTTVDVFGGKPNGQTAGPSSPHVHWHVFWAAGAANILGLGAGCVLTWTSPSLLKLKDPNSTLVLTDDEASWVGSLTPLGAAIGPVPAGILADSFGRKPTMIGDSALFLLSWILIALASSPAWLYAARFIAGIATGCLFTVLPMYVGEIAVDSVRSTLGSLLQLSLTIGFLIPYGAGPFIPGVWLAVASGVIPIVFTAEFMSMPESPCVLLARGDREGASRALQWLRGQTADGVRKELQQLLEETQDAASKKSSVLQSFLQIFSTRGNIKAFYLGCGLLLFQQTSGINAVLFYSEGIFKQTGSSMSPAVSTIIIGVVQVVASAGTLGLTARFSMKHLLIFSAVGMGIAHGALGYFFYMVKRGDDVSSVGALPIASLVVYIIVYCFGFGPLPWAVLGEMFPGEVKAISSAVCASFCWILGFLVTLYFANLVTAVGPDCAFWGFGVCCFVGAAFTAALLPNTRGKSLPEIQDILNGRA